MFISSLEPSWEYTTSWLYHCNGCVFLFNLLGRLKVCGSYLENVNDMFYKYSSTLSDKCWPKREMWRASATNCTASVSEPILFVVRSSSYFFDAYPQVQSDHSSITSRTLNNFIVFTCRLHCWSVFRTLLPLKFRFATNGKLVL